MPENNNLIEIKKILNNKIIDLINSSFFSNLNDLNIEECLKQESFSGEESLLHKLS